MVDRETRPRCWTCWRPEEACLCHVIRPFETRTHFVLLMHPREARLHHLGTGRLTRACIPSTSIRVGREFRDDPAVRAWIDDPTYQTYLLYPGGAVIADLLAGPAGLGDGQKGVGVVGERASATPGATEPPAAFDPTRPIRLFLLDATWTQAKGLLLRSPNLLALPRVSIDPEEPSRFNRIRQQPGRLCLSTIESVHRWIVEANAAGMESTGTAHDVLIEVLDELCRYQIACASDPDRPGYRRKPYKREAERIPARWETRRKFFVK